VVDGDEVVGKRVEKGDGRWCLYAWEVSPAQGRGDALALVRVPSKVMRRREAECSVLYCNCCLCWYFVLLPTALGRVNFAAQQRLSSHVVAFSLSISNFSPPLLA
jgi:hypothetical protein